MIQYYKTHLELSQYSRHDGGRTFIYLYYFILLNQFHTRSVFYSNSRDSRNVAIAYTFMEQLYQCADIKVVIFLEKIMIMITNVIDFL